MEVKRASRLADLLAQSFAAFLISIAGVLIIDGLFALLGLGKFGDMNGFLALVFPIIFFAGQYSAAKGERGRPLVAAIGAFFGLGVGSISAGMFPDMSPIGTGALGAFVATIIYATIWHVGLAIAKK
ncbi:hypothetical protein [Catelliglobosispora koreensis]|uniref:hypothetical protein n=1 Tax=Catelliglobosispora koreensis TaxID=129052 RepID=UPI00035CC0F8|nr:hypothetical protein [Catelliglobosispora koreensis]